MATDLEMAVATLKAKQKPYSNFWDYFEGSHPLVYNTKRMKEVFHELDARFTTNWCAVVVNSVFDRVQLEQVVVNENDAATALLEELLFRNELLLEADDVHLAALVCGESFLFIWPDDEGRAASYYNDPRNVHLFYEAENPRRVRYGCKWWVDDDRHRRLTLYYPDRLEYYRSLKPVDKVAGELGLSAKSFDTFAPTERNEYGIVPIFHFRRDRRGITSELQNAIEPQDAINKLLADMMVAAEYGAFKQRWVITNATIGNLKNSPNRIWEIPAGDGQGQASSAGEFSATDLDNYLDAIDRLATAIGIITRTPKHYFYAQAGDPSGEALIAMEAPLNHKAEKYIANFQPVWQRALAFMLQLEGIVVEPTDMYVQFDDPSTVQPLTQSLIRQNSVAAGIPLVNVLRDEGWTESDLEQMADDKAQETEQQRAQLGTALANAMRDFDQNGNEDVEE